MMENNILLLKSLVFWPSSLSHSLTPSFTHTLKYPLACLHTHTNKTKIYTYTPPAPVHQLDQCVQEDSAVYKSFRFKGSIGPMRVQMVAEGAFKELRKQMMAFSNTSANTFKMHRVLRRKEYADFLLGKTI